MEQYIPKSALVAEITQKIKVLEAFVKNFDEISDKVEKAKNKIEALGDMLLFIETLEVKEVDLETEINKYISDYFFGSETIGFFAVRTYEEPNEMDMALCAKHFFELGIKSKSSYVGTPNIDDTLKEMGIDPDSKEANSFKNSYYKALDKFKKKKGI